MNYYTDIDDYICRWLKNLVGSGSLPPGLVDKRDIHDIKPRGLEKYTQVHFCCGIGGWPLALQMAGWPKDRPVWSCSLPCQPFSNAGKQKGTKDERHLWPELRRLVKKCRPTTIFGEQVASKLGRTWLARVQADPEALGYSTAAADLCAASIGAPHIRQRLYWVASKTSGLAESERIGWRGRDIRCDAGNTRRLLTQDETAGSRNAGGLGDPLGSRIAHTRSREAARATSRVQGTPEERELVWANPWEPSDFIYCRDDKARRTEPGLFPMAASIPRDVGPILAKLAELGYDTKDSRRIITEARESRAKRLRGYGNSIIPSLAALFIKSFLECEDATA